MSRMLTDIEYAFRQIRLAKQHSDSRMIVIDCLQRAEDALERVKEAATLQEAGRNCCDDINRLAIDSAQQMVNALSK